MRPLSAAECVHNFNCMDYFFSRLCQLQVVLVTQQGPSEMLGMK